MVNETLSVSCPEKASPFPPAFVTHAGTLVKEPFSFLTISKGATPPPSKRGISKIKPRVRGLPQSIIGMAGFVGRIIHNY